MPIQILTEHTHRDTRIRYVIDSDTQAVGLILFPDALADQLADKRDTLKGLPYIDAIPDADSPPARSVDPLIHIKLTGDWYSAAFAQGHTMRDSASNQRFRYADQQTHTKDNRTTITTLLDSQDGLRLEHRLSFRDDDPTLTITTTFRNDAGRPVTLEALTSFSLGGITPFDSADAPNRLTLHRFRSGWSAEARLESQTIEQLHLERSWSGAAAFSERFGQLGSMPVRQWFPFLAVTDTQTNVTWGAQLAWAGSWQLEAYRQHDELCLSGGLADREFGHWTKTIRPGEAITTPPATLACVHGSLDDLCDRLTDAQQHFLEQQPDSEDELPIIFNEWCTTWGDPTHDRVTAIADRIQHTGIRYLVIDAGWYKQGTGDWGNGHGDWIPSGKLFPDGLKATAEAIRQRGIIPGLWFELETVGSASLAWNHTDLLLKRDGQPLSVRDRRFWDLHNPEVADLLAERVIDQLRNAGFGYLKVDYNETIGIGSDHPDSLGEGLRLHTHAVHRFFDRIRSELPDLVIENCSSGGHRLEPSMLSRTAMSSFSDAHELPEIPIIAANLHQLILPRQNQIWAVLHDTDSDQRLLYSLAATFLGRMCLSGDIETLSSHQMSLVQRAIDLYRQAAPIIRDGISRRTADLGPSWRHPTGWQAVTRINHDHTQALIVLHAFANTPNRISVPLPPGDWNQSDTLNGDDCPSTIIEGNLIWSPRQDFSATVSLLHKV